MPQPHLHVPLFMLKIRGSPYEFGDTQQLIHDNIAFLSCPHSAAGTHSPVIWRSPLPYRLADNARWSWPFLFLSVLTSPLYPTPGSDVAQTGLELDTLR